MFPVYLNDFNDYIGSTSNYRWKALNLFTFFSDFFFSHIKKTFEQMCVDFYRHCNYQDLTNFFLNPAGFDAICLCLGISLFCRILH